MSKATTKSKKQKQETPVTFESFVENLRNHFKSIQHVNKACIVAMLHDETLDTMRKTTFLSLPSLSDDKAQPILNRRVRTFVNDLVEDIECTDKIANDFAIMLRLTYDDPSLQTKPKTVEEALTILHNIFPLIEAETNKLETIARSGKNITDISNGEIQLVHNVDKRIRDYYYDTDTLGIDTWLQPSAHIKTDETLNKTTVKDTNENDDDTISTYEIEPVCETESTHVSSQIESVESHTGEPVEIENIDKKPQAKGRAKTKQVVTLRTEKPLPSIRSIFMSLDNEPSTAPVEKKDIQPNVNTPTDEVPL